jgi:hypothetical protein
MIYRGNHSLSEDQEEYLLFCEQLAERFIQIEKQTQDLNDIGAASLITKSVQKRLETIRVELKEHPLAGKILFQTHAWYEEMQKRRNTLAETVLGISVYRANDSYLAHPDSDDDEQFQTTEEAFEFLNNELSVKVLGAVHMILFQCLEDMVEKELPSAPKEVLVEDNDLPSSWFF